MFYATGIVAEYNPFHNGHLYQLQIAKKLTGQPVVIVMSASMMQRGEPAFLSKWTRARLAVENGAALVLELPAAFSLRSAQYFASGAVQILEASGCINKLLCGVESPGVDFLSLAREISAPAAQEKLLRIMRKGAGYAAACAEVLAQAVPLTQPNDILALEYSKALLGAGMEPLFCARLHAGHKSTEIRGSIASASAIRLALGREQEEKADAGIFSGEVLAEAGAWRAAVPENVRRVLENEPCGYDEKLLQQLLAYRLRLLTAAEISARCQASEGLENLLKRAANFSSLDDIIKSCTGKRYTAARIRRLLLQILLDCPRALWEHEAPAYIRVLAFDDTGRKFLQQMRTSATLPVITKTSSALYAKTLAALPEKLLPAYRQQLELELKATDLWSMLQKNPALARAGNDFINKPIYIQ